MICASLPSFPQAATTVSAKQFSCTNPQMRQLRSVTIADTSAEIVGRSARMTHVALVDLYKKV
jgi:hypothetical protein